MKGIKQIKNYRLTREIGKGTAGTVFEAIDEKTNKLAAVKSIQSLKLKDKRVMENFKRELKLLHGLNHNNIVKIAGVEKTVNNIYLILEYCNGGNLYEYLHFYKKLNGALLPEENVQVILRQLIDGLEYMHNCRTIHRDIKLENILVNFNAVSNIVKPGESVFKIDYAQMDLLDITIKIADLGYARELEGAGVASTMCGTPITMAPDIVGLFNTNSINKDNKYNNKVDLWSLGAITYELIVGRPVFLSNNVKQLFEEIMNGRYMIPQNLKISLEAISFINGLLQFYPDKRMNWNQIRNHPFIVNDFRTFHYIDLTTVENSHEKVMVDTKDCENLLWVLYQTNFSDNIHIDKIDKEVFKTKANEILDVGKNSKEDYSEDEKKKKENELVFDNEHKPKENLDTLARNNEVLLKEKGEFKREESDEYEEANNEICICDEEIDVVQENSPKIKENVEQTEMRKTEMERESKGNKVFGKLLMEMEKDLKTSKNNSKVNNIEESVKEIATEFDKETETYVANKCETEIVKSPADQVVEIKQEQIEDNKNTSYDDCAINTNEENFIKDDSADKQPEDKLKDNELAITNENFLENARDTRLSKVEKQHPDHKQIDEVNGGISMSIPSMQEKDSPTPERESKLIQIESISEEGISSDYKGNLIISVNKTLPILCEGASAPFNDDYLEVNTEAEEKSASKKEDEDDIWELISTTSITEGEISVEKVEYGFDLIQEYF